MAARQNFHLFPLLLLELRLLIWEDALGTEAQQRIVPFHLDESNYGGLVIPMKNLVSPLLLTSRESRDCATKWYDAKIQVFTHKCSGDRYKVSHNGNGKNGSVYLRRTAGFLYLRLDRHIFLQTCTASHGYNSSLTCLDDHDHIAAEYQYGELRNWIVRNCDATLSFRHRMKISHALYVTPTTNPKKIWLQTITSFPRLNRLDMITEHRWLSQDSSFAHFFQDLQDRGLDRALQDYREQHIVVQGRSGEFLSGYGTGYDGKPGG
ncbi:hypothetical protein TruAng_008904 [Truncatella angustata]|nr:hypothetical protein TruAng_008904 [Truncatella angustata]